MSRISMWLFKQFIRFQVFMYRRSGGRRFGRMRGMPLLLLTTVGRKTGQQRVTPVMYIRDGTTYVITASNSGADKHPSWFVNLQATPHTTIEVDGITRRVLAHRASPEDKGRLWAQLVRQAPFFEGYRKKTRRDIPMVILQPTDEAQPGGASYARHSTQHRAQANRRQGTMSRFTDAEIAYLQSQRLGRMATVSATGELHVVPVGFRYNPEHDTIDIGGHNVASSKKYRDAVRHGRIAIVVDDVLPPWTPRFVEVRGTVQALAEGGHTINAQFAPDMLRLTPTYIVSFGINDAGIMPGAQQQVNYHGRRVE